MTFTLTRYDASILWRFFDGISTAVAARMSSGSSPGEENLTFLLCELLDVNTTSLHALAYPLSQAQRDLGDSDSAMTVDIQFQTHEHSKHVESKYSGADLGIVLEIAHPLRKYERRGFLIQAKRLFSRGKGRDFGIHSGYDSFDRTQANFLKALQERFGAWNSIFYLWYNPSSMAFPADEARVLKAYETQANDLLPYWGRIHPMLDELIDMGFPFSFPMAGPANAGVTDDESKLREWRATQPALRISNLEIALAAAEHGAPRLKGLYDLLLEHRRTTACFSPFAEFFLLMLASRRFGSSNDEWVRLAEGQRVSMPPLKSTDQKHTDLDELGAPPIPRHTLRVTLRSTLPQIG